MMNIAAVVYTSGAYNNGELMFMRCSRIIWLGDLNYRVSMSYEETKMLLEDNDWNTLLEKDQV